MELSYLEAKLADGLAPQVQISDLFVPMSGDLPEADGAADRPGGDRRHDIKAPPPNPRIRHYDREQNLDSGNQQPTGRSSLSAIGEPDPERVMPDSGTFAFG
jgi:hypothetical protein